MMLEESVIDDIDDNVYFQIRKNGNSPNSATLYILRQEVIESIRDRKVYSIDTYICSVREDQEGSHDIEKTSERFSKDLSEENYKRAQDFIRENAGAKAINYDPDSTLSLPSYSRSLANLIRHILESQVYCS